MSETRRIHLEEIRPFWEGLSQRERMFRELPPEWHDAYEAGIFTEFQEQRSPGHTVLGETIYQKGIPRPETRNPRRHRRARFRDRPAGLRQARATPRHGPLRGLADRLRQPPRRAARRTRRRRKRPGARRRTAEHGRNLPQGARQRAGDLPRGVAILLVRPHRRDHRTEPVGLVQPRPARPAPVAVLSARTRRRHPHRGKRHRAAAGVLGEVPQPPGPAQGRRHRAGKRHLHRLRPDQPRRREARRHRTRSTT